METFCSLFQAKNGWNVPCIWSVILGDVTAFRDLSIFKDGELYLSRLKKTCIKKVYLKLSVSNWLKKVAFSAFFFWNGNKCYTKTGQENKYGSPYLRHEGLLLMPSVDLRVCMCTCIFNTNDFVYRLLNIYFIYFSIYGPSLVYSNSFSCCIIMKYPK